MVKADLKHNYYADLELPTSASLDDVRKAYRKLALQYHPDRNAGKEDQCVPKFQAIQAANEVLGDQASKQKYDMDRRKAGLYPVGQTFNPRQPGAGNPYAANSAYPPPPRRTQPNTWQRPYPTPGTAPQYAPNGADRFSNFPRPSPPARKDPTTDRANNFKAWDSMNNPQNRQRNFVPPNAGPQPPPQAQANQQRPQPPSRQETKFPTDEQIRAGTKYRNGPAVDPSTAQPKQSAWSAFNQANAGKPGMPAKGQQPSTNTPRRQGFNPNLPGSDEKPADARYSSRNYPAGFGVGKSSTQVPPPPRGPPQASTSTTPTSPVSPTSQRPYPDPTRPFSSRTPNDQVPFAEGTRNRTPYASFIHEKTDLGDGLRRSFSTRDTTKLGPDDAANKGRARSTSPLRRQRAGEAHAQAHESAKQKAFDLGCSSSDTSESDLNTTQTPEDANGSTGSYDPSRPGTAPNTAPPFDRPKKVPTPPSSRLNGSRAGPTSPPPVPPMPRMNGATDGAQSEGERPMQQKFRPNMYANPSISSFVSNPQPSTSRKSRFLSTFRARRTWSNVGRWGIPSSLNPAFRAQQNDTRDPSFVTGADVIFKSATKDEQSAYFRLQSELEAHYDYIPDNFDMEVFLKLASTARREVSCGDETVDRLLSRVLLDFPTVGYPPNTNANENVRANSFAFPHDNDMFTPTNAKSRSEENINTNFSPNGWSGAFSGEPDYFAPSTSTGRKVSPTRRPTGSRTPKDQSRPATMDYPPPTSAPREEVPQRPWGSDGIPKGTPPIPNTAPGEVKFSKEEWEKTFQDASWTWPAPPPRQGSPAKSGVAGQARKQSQGRRTSKAGAKNVPVSKQQHQPSTVDEDDTVEVEGANGRPENGASVVDDVVDPMDIDNTPPAQHIAPQQDNSSAQTPEKEARLYSVPKSAWRQQQEQNHTPAHRKTSSASRRAARASVSDGAKLNTTLDDLRNVEPISKSTDSGVSGLQYLGDMGESLPFQSRAAPTLHPQLLVPQRRDIPDVPKAPQEPTRLTKMSFHNYSQSFGEYLKAFHQFNSIMLQHYTAREKVAEARFMSGCAWLEATGDTTGGQGFGGYLKAVEEDEAVRECWNIGCEKHVEACKAFDKLRERVKRSAFAGGLPDS